MVFASAAAFSKELRQARILLLRPWDYPYFTCVSFPPSEIAPAFFGAQRILGEGRLHTQQRLGDGATSRQRRPLQRAFTDVPAPAAAQPPRTGVPRCDDAVFQDPSCLRARTASKIRAGKNHISQMKHIFKIVAVLVAISALWIALLETSTVPRSYTWLLPIYLVVGLGCYGLFMVGFGLMFFPTCPQEAILLQQDIAEAKEFLAKNGVDVGSE